jgi:hypothetical protein
MFGIQWGDLIDVGLFIVLLPAALAGYRINQRCKDRRAWWSHVDGFLTERHSAALSTPSSNLGLALFSGALVGMFVLLLATAFRHHVAGSFIFLTLWVPMMVGLLGVVCLPVLLIARWTTRAVAGLKQAR